MLTFFIGLHQPSDAHRFPHACISIRRLWRRAKKIPGCRALIDSGAFTELDKHGKYMVSVSAYALRLHQLHTRGIVDIAGAVAQDFMCEDFMLEKVMGIPKDTITPEQRVDQILKHQQWSVVRYDDLIAELERLFGGEIPFPVLPVLQGYAPEDYVRHISMYGDRLKPGMWVGVGSVCKRNGDPESILAVLQAIKAERPDLRIHGFGVKKTALKSREIVNLLATADSMAWSYHARINGRSGNSWEEAQAFVDQIYAIAA
jgi:hypothetical protein